MAQIDVISFEQIATMLSQLATNYSNLFADYYNLFYNPTPMDVTVELYDDSGNLETITIPNRAKDRTYILNGEGEPEGAVEAEKGSVYQDLTNGIVYVKQFTTSDSTGWSELVTIGSLSEYLLQDVGSPEGKQTADKGILYVDKGNANLYIKTTDIGNTGWVLISADTTDFANRNLSNLTSAGENYFLNKALGNLNEEGQIRWNSKENVSNKKSEWITGSTSNVNDTNYPTTKLVYDEITGRTNVLANKDLSNLNDEGEDHFVRTFNQVRDGIFKAPNGLPSKGQSKTIYLLQGTVLLCANGLDTNRASVNEEVTVNNLNVTLSWSSADEGVLFFNKTGNNLIYYSISGYSRGQVAPSGLQNMIWFDTNANKYKITSNSGSTWTEIVCAEIGSFRTDSTGSIVSFIPRHPFVSASVDDVNNITNILNDKANVSLSNINDDAKILVSGMSMPSETYDNLALGASGTTYTAPANGWVMMTQNLTNGYIALATVYSSLDGICMQSVTGGTTNVNVYIPVSKGETFKVAYSGTFNSDQYNRFQFIYAKGSESEASSI